MIVQGGEVQGIVGMWFMLLFFVCCVVNKTK